jgi:hypothetical protein
MLIKTILRFQLTPVRWLSSITKTTVNAGEDVGRREHFHTVHESINECNCYGKQYGGL